MNYYIMYLRKSRADRPDESVEEVVAKHESILQEYAEKHFGHKIAERYIYREVVSGETIDSRPAMKLVLKIIEDPNCIGVIVVEPQRLSRGDLKDCGTIVDSFRYSKTKICTPIHDYDLDNDMDRRFFKDELLRGNDYLEYIKTILHRGRVRSVKDGKYLGSLPPFGYDKIIIDKKHTLCINEQECYYVRLMFSMYLDGYGCRSIAIELNNLGAKTKKGNAFTPQSVRKILTNDVYTGKVHWQKRIHVNQYRNGNVVRKQIANNPDKILVVDGLHPAIIDQDTFDKTQNKIGKIVKSRADSKLINPLAGLIMCAQCGKSLRYRVFGRSGIKTRFYCSRTSYKQCNTRPVDGNLIVQAVIKALRQHMEDIKVKIESGDDSEDESIKAMIKELKKQLKELDNRQEALYEYLEKKVYTPELFADRQKVLDEDRERVESSISELEKKANNKTYIKEQYKMLHEAIDAMNDDSISALAKNNFLKSVVKKIYYDQKEGDFDLKIILK